MARGMERSEQTGATTSVGQTSPVGQAFRPDSIPGLEYERFFAREGIDPFDEVEWDLRSAVIGSEKGAQSPSSSRQKTQLWLHRLAT